MKKNLLLISALFLSLFANAQTCATVTATSIQVYAGVGIVLNFVAPPNATGYVVHSVVPTCYSPTCYACDYGLCNQLTYLEPISKNPAVLTAWQNIQGSTTYNLVISFYTSSVVPATFICSNQVSVTTISQPVCLAPYQLTAVYHLATQKTNITYFGMSDSSYTVKVFNSTYANQVNTYGNEVELDIPAGAYQMSVTSNCKAGNISSGNYPLTVVIPSPPVTSSTPIVRPGKKK